MICNYTRTLNLDAFVLPVCITTHTYTLEKKDLQLFHYSLSLSFSLRLSVSLSLCTSRRSSTAASALVSCARPRSKLFADVQLFPFLMIQFLNILCPNIFKYNASLMLTRSTSFHVSCFDNQKHLLCQQQWRDQLNWFNWIFEAEFWNRRSWWTGVWASSSFSTPFPITL